MVPVIHKSSEIENKVCTRGSGQSIRELEELLADKSSSSYEIPYPASFADQIIEGGTKTKVSLFINRSSLTHTLETVRNKILDLLLEFKKGDSAVERTTGQIQKAVGGIRLPGGIALGPLMFSKDGKTASTIMGPAIIPFDYGITNSLNNLNKTDLPHDEFQAAFNSQVEDLIAETLIYFQNRLKSIAKGNVGQFNSVDRCIKEYEKHKIDVKSLCDADFLLEVDRVRGRKHHSDRRYDADYSIGGLSYDSVEKLRELNRKVHAIIHALNDSLAVTHKDYDVKVTQTQNGVSIEFTATSHAFDLTRGGKTVPKKEKDSAGEESLDEI
ncbi:MAG: hypothetical protein A3E07_00765 [Candidatus Wildermuthbacteria bacterium RIFCSPHIGHO2_12_FULL_45_9]|nr:MAG: hypothetical protein A3E07_00765 [Candidatus Wildermuthbacteria bacterium RIFCSPHIGHO2_12_FULL_45_9]